MRGPLGGQSRGTNDAHGRSLTYSRSAFLATSLLALVGTVACPAPGEGPEADHGRARGSAIIAALTRFDADSGHYPSDLENLVPELLPPSAIAVPEAPGERYPWEYETTGRTFVLRFRYAGSSPGMTTCSYKSSKPMWVCGGYL
jgi:hypothetical protein